MVKKSKEMLIYGNIIFLIGIAILIVASLFNLNGTPYQLVVATLFCLGTIIGILNITEKESVSFIIAGVAVVMLLQPILTAISQVFNLQTLPALLRILGSLYVYLTALIVPAILVVSFKTLFRTAKDE